MSEDTPDTSLGSKRSKPVQCAIAAGAALAIVVAVIFVWRFVSSHSSQGEDSRQRWFVCAETKKSFQAELEIGMTIPIMSPFSHKATGYPAELCYWNADGTIRKDPTPVLLNSYLGDNSPTFCPVCQRLVVGQMGPPVPGRPPPTRDEWTKRLASRGSNDSAKKE